MLLVRSTDAIPEPFVTFLVEVNWARGRLDARIHRIARSAGLHARRTCQFGCAGDGARQRSTAAPPAARKSAPVAATPLPSTPSPSPSALPSTPATAPSHPTRASRAAHPKAAAAPSEAAAPSSLPPPAAEAFRIAPGASTYRVAKGDTLTKIARSLHADTRADIDQTMIAVYRANPEAFGGNINILRSGAVLRVPGADEIAALESDRGDGRSASPDGCVARCEWRERRAVHHRSFASGHPGLRAAVRPTRVPPRSRAIRRQIERVERRNAGAARTGQGSGRPAGRIAPAARSARATSCVSCSASSVRRRPPTPPAAAPPATAPPAPTPRPRPLRRRRLRPSRAPTAPAPLPPPAESTAPTPVPVPAPTPVKKPAAAPESGSWIDWVAANWWLPAALILALIIGLVIAARRRRPTGGGDFPEMDSTDIAEFRDPTARLASGRAGDDSFVVEESGEHPDAGFQ